MNNTLNFLDVKVEAITFKTFKDFILVNHDGVPLLIQTPYMELYSFGMPRRDKYHTTDEQLQNIKIPIENEEFKEMIKAIDKRMSDEEFKKKYLGDKHEKYSYHSILAEKENKPDAFKIKFALKRNESQDIETLLYTTKETKGKIERTLIDKPTIDDFIKYIPFRSTVRCIFQIVRVWTQPVTLKTPAYGLALKLIKIEVKEKPESKFNCEFVDEEINVEHFDISTEEYVNNSPLDVL